ncbi:MAG: hypothetical protein ACJA2S_005632 [Cyclobacteriaceae bacterium]|jgi:hypothetical protein
MPKIKNDTLFTLIKSLKKSEKRYFKTSEAKQEDMKFIRLFDLVDKQDEFDEDNILKKDKSIKPTQLSNLKAHLYTKILQSLRMYNSSSVAEIGIHNLIDHVQILFNKSLYQQCISVLKKARKNAERIDNLELQLEILNWEKKLLPYTTGKNTQADVNEIVMKVQDVSNRINNINAYSNLHLQLNSIYNQVGYMRSEEDFKKVNALFESSFPNPDEELLSVSEKINLYSLYINYYFFIQNFERGYEYAKSWVQLFHGDKTLMSSKIEMYISALNHLMIAQNKLEKYEEFLVTKKELRSVGNLPAINLNDNIKLKLLKYSYVHEFNALFMMGDFEHGVQLIEKIKPGLEHFIEQTDSHSKVIMFYKTACLYFGNANFKDAIFWLNKIINSTDVNIREDIHGFARILSLICHYELGNIELIEYNVRSTYRFLLKTQDLHLFQRYILNFLRKLNATMTDKELIRRFKRLRENLIPLTDNQYEKRAFIYFDIISWLESKIENRMIRDIVKEKAEVRERVSAVN